MSDQHSNDSSRTDPTRALEVGRALTEPHRPARTPRTGRAGCHHLGHASSGRAAGRPAAGTVGRPGRGRRRHAARARGGRTPGRSSLGLLCLLVAGLAIAREVNGFRVDWAVFGPGAIVGIGVLVLVLGVLGLARRER